MKGGREIMTSKSKRWIHGLLSALVGGFFGAISSGFGSMVVAPNEFNIGNGLMATIKLMAMVGVVNGLVTMSAFLKQAPLPPIENGTDVKTPMLLIPLIFTLFVGCTTTGLNVSRSFGIAASIGTQYRLTKHPEDRPKFELAKVALDALIADGTYDPVKFNQVVKSLPKVQANITEGDIALAIWNEVVVGGVMIGPENFRTVVISIRDGIARGLSIQDRPPQ